VDGSYEYLFMGERLWEDGCTGNSFWLGGYEERVQDEDECQGYENDSGPEVFPPEIAREGCHVRYTAPYFFFIVVCSSLGLKWGWN